MEIKPQDGFQMKFLSSPADIVIGGGAAGCGKTFAEIIEPLRNKDTKGFGAVFFRRTVPQIKNIGGLWDEASKIYPLFNGKPNNADLTWTFPSGALIKFNHLEHEKNIYDHQGAQYPLIIFDELTHFTKRMFIYLLSRNRSICGIKPYIRATCNPDPDSWVLELIQWWINEDTGYPIPERDGKIRYFTIDKGEYIWGETKEEVKEKASYLFDKDEFKDINIDELIKSITFIHGTIYGNKKLLETNPSYLSNLMAQEDDEKLRLLEGNWKVRMDELCLFDYSAVNDIFTNYFDESQEKYITCDAARFGKDRAVIYTWKGWRVINTIVISKSDVHDLVKAIEGQRQKFGISKSKVIIDQDGVGDGVVKTGGYLGFQGGSPALKDPDTRIKENYKNLKTQCFYRLADKVNRAELSMDINKETVIIDNYYDCKMKYSGKVVDVRDIIKQQLRAIKRKDPDNEGKKMINSKDEQKVILNGNSPDFADTLMMRSYFDLVKITKMPIRW